MSDDKKIRAEATAGIYAEVLEQIYDSVDKRIREAVSNAFDAGASSIRIAVFMGKEDKIMICDNGVGMDEDEVKGKYVNLGGGDNYNNEETIGRIGIGALSVFGLGDKIKIRTRKKGGDKILTAHLDFTEIKKARKHATLLKDMLLGEISGYSDVREEDLPHFTEITITELSKVARSIFNSPTETKELIDKLERILPVAYRADDPIHEKLNSEIVKKIKQIKYISNVELHIPHLEYSNYKIMRKSIWSAGEANVKQWREVFPVCLEEGSDSRLNVFGYLYINSAKQLPKAWQGISAKVKNVAIEQNTYFGFLEDQQARARIGGEIFIGYLDENHAIQSNRSGFAIENKDYILIATFMRQRIQEAVNLVRRNSTIDSLVKKIVNHLGKLYEVFEFVSLQRDDKDGAPHFKTLKDTKVKEITDTKIFSLEEYLAKELQKEEVDNEFIWSGTLEDTLYYIEPHEDNFFSIHVHSKLKNMHFDVAGNTVEYLICFLGEQVPIAVKKEGRIYINLDSDIIAENNILGLDPSFTKVVLIMYFNYLLSRGDAEVLYRNTLGDLRSGV